MTLKSPFKNLILYAIIFFSGISLIEKNFFADGEEVVEDVPTDESDTTTTDTTEEVTATIDELDLTKVKLNAKAADNVVQWAAKVVALDKSVKAAMLFNGIPKDLWDSLNAIVGSKPYYDPKNTRDYRVNDPAIYQYYRAVKNMINKFAVDYTDCGIGFTQTIDEAAKSEEYTFDDTMLNDQAAGYEVYGVGLKNLMAKMYQQGTYTAAPFPELRALFSKLNDTKTIYICVSGALNTSREFLFLQNDSNVCLGNQSDPLDTKAQLTMELAEDKVRIKSGDLYLTVTDVVDEFNKLETTKIKFAEQASPAEKNTQLFYLQPQENGFYISSALYPDGFIAFDPLDNSIRAKTKDSLQVISQSSATLFLIRPYSVFMQRLFGTRAEKVFANKMNVFNDLLKQRANYFTNVQDLYMFLAEIYCTPGTTANPGSTRYSMLSDPNLRAILATENDTVNTTFSNFVTAIDQAFPIARAEGTLPAAPWWDSAKTLTDAFAKVSGLMVTLDEFNKLAYPQQVQSLVAPLDRLSKTSIGEYLARLAIVTAPLNIINAFDGDLVTLKTLITKVQSKTDYTASLASGKQFDPVTALTTVTALQKFDVYVSDQKNLQNIFNGLDSLLTKKGGMNSDDKDLFIKQVERLVSVKGSFPSPQATYTKTLKDKIQVAANNLMLDRAARLNALANILEEDLWTAFNDLKTFSAQLSFLEARRLTVSDVGQISIFLASLRSLINNMFKATAQEKTRIQTLVGLLPNTARFKAVIEGKSADGKENMISTDGQVVTNYKNDLLAITDSDEFKGKTIASVVQNIINTVAKADQSDQVYQVVMDYAASVAVGTNGIVEPVIQEDLMSIFDAMTNLLASDYLTVVFAKNLKDALVQIKSNTPQAVMDKVGLMFDDTNKKLDAKIDSINNKQRQKTQFTINLEMAEKKGALITSSASTSDIRSLLELLIQLVDQRLGASNQDETVRLTRLVQATINKTVVVNASLVNITGLEGKLILKSDAIAFLKNGVDPAKNSPTLAQRVADIDRTIDIVASGMVDVKVITDKVNAAISMLNSNAKAADVMSLLTVVKKILYEVDGMKNYYDIFYPMKDLLDQKYNSLTVTDTTAFGSKTYTEQVADLKKRANSLSSSNKKAFIDDLSAVIANNVQASTDDQTALIKDVLNVAQFDSVFRNDPINNLNWFTAQITAVQQGPSIDTLLNFIANKISGDKGLIETMKSSTPPSEIEKGFIIQKILALQALIQKDGSREMLAKIGSVTDSNTVLFLINALKIRVMPEKASMLDKISSEFLALKDTINKSGQAKVVLFADDLNDLSARVEAIYTNPGADDISSKIDAFKQKVAAMVANLPKAIDDEPIKFVSILDDANRVEKIASDPGFAYQATVDLIKAGPTALQILAQIRSLSQSKDALSPRDVQNLIQLAQAASTNKAAFSTVSDGVATLSKISQELKSVATFRLKNLKYKQTNGKQDDATNLAKKVAADLDNFIDQSSQGDAWTSTQTLLTNKINAYQLNDKANFDKFAEDIKKIAKQLVYLTDDQFDSLVGLFSEQGKVQNSKANLSNAGSLYDAAVKPSGLLSLLIKPTYTQKADNFMILASKKELPSYDEMVMLMMRDLFSDARMTMAMAENYDLKKVKSSLQFYFDNSLASLDDTDVNKIEVSSKIKQLDNMILSATNKSQADQTLIASIEDRLRNAKTVANVAAVFADIDKLMLMRAQLSKENSALFLKRVLTSGKNITSWQTIVRNSSPNAVAYRAILDGYASIINQDVTNTDRLNWLNMKVYGVPTVKEGAVPSPIKLSADEQNMFSTIAQAAYDNAKFSTAGELSAFSLVLGDAYYTQTKMPSDDKIGNLAIQFEDLSKQKSSGQTFSEILDVLKVSITAVTSSNVAEFISMLKDANSKIVEALPDELKAFQAIIASAQPKKMILNNADYKNTLTSMVNGLANPFSYSQIYRFLCAELGLDTNANPAPGISPDPILTSTDRGPARKSLLIAKFKECLALASQAPQKSDLDNFRKLLMSAKNNEMADVSTSIDPIISDLDKLLLTFATSDFKKFITRLNDLRAALTAIGQQKTADTDKKISAFLDSIQPQLLDYISEADTSATNDEVAMVRDFLNKVVRVHALVFPVQANRERVDKYVASLDVPLDVSFLATKLKNFAYNNSSFTDDLKNAFKIVLAKMVAMRDKATPDLIKDTQTNVLDYVLGDGKQFSKDASIQTMRDTLSTPLVPPFDDLIANKKYVDAFNLLVNQVRDPNSKKFAPDKSAIYQDKNTWKNNLVKVTVTYIDTILGTKTSKTDKLDLVRSATILANSVRNIILTPDPSKVSQADKDKDQATSLSMANFVYSNVTKSLLETQNKVNAQN